MGGRLGKGLRAALVGAVLLGVLAGCGDDDDGEASTDTTAAESGGESADNTVRIEMLDYGYKVTGDLKSGLATLQSTNTGAEWHMAGFAKLKEGRTVEQLVTALQSAGGEDGGPAEAGGATETTGSGATLRAAGQETTTTTAAEGGGEGEGGDPFAEFVEEELGSPGHILQPGRTQTLTVDNLDAGSYVMICFLPTEGEGTPHFAKGMVSGFEVAEEAADVEEPDADATIVLGDEAEPTGVPTQLSSGEHTFKVTAQGENGKDFVIAQLDEGKEFAAFEEYFESENGFESEDGPPKGYAEQAPGTVVASTFEISPGQSMWVTVDVPRGETYFVGTTNVEDDDTEDTVDKFVKVDVS